MPAVIVIIVVILLIPVLIYNSLIRRKNQVLNVFATIDTLLKKRYDLIPNLVAAVKGYAKHEKTLLDEITNLRSKALSAGASDDQKVELDNTITKALIGLVAAHII